jgi:hypothetical protein
MSDFVQMGHLRKPMQREIQSKPTKIILALCIGSLIVATFVGLFVWRFILTSQVAFTSSPSLTGVVILLEISPFGDAQVIASHFDTKKRQTLFDIQFEDSNESVLKFAWSPDGSLAGWLIMDSKRFPMGKRLIVFDFKSFPENIAQLKADVTHEDIIDFEFTNNGIRYLLKNGRTIQINQ